MDNLAYLNQISQNNKPKKRSFFSKKWVKPAVFILLSLAILIPIISGISNLISSRETDFLPRLNYRVSNLSRLIYNYSSRVKSSTLRNESASLSAILTDLNTNLPLYYDDPSKSLSNEIITEEISYYTTAKASIDNGIINGYLDRNYARQIAYYIKIILTLIDEASEKTNNTTAKSFLATKKTELELKKPTFADFIDVSK